MNYVLYFGFLVIGSAIFCLAAWRKHSSAFGFAVVLVGFSRFIPASSRAMWGGEDQYWYWLYTEPIIRSGHIPAMSSQYAQDSRAYTVIFNILATIIRAVTGVTNPEILRNYLPLIMVLGFFLGGLLILSQVFPTYQALIGAYLYTMLGATTIESLTYTQFGFFSSISLFLFTIYYLNTNIDHWRRTALVLIFTAVVALSHVMATFVFIAWILAHNVIVSIYNQLPTPNLPWQLRSKTINADLFIIVFMISVQIFILYSFFGYGISTILSSFSDSAQATAAGVGESGPTNPGFIILNYGTIITKIVLAVGAVAAFVMHLRGDLSDGHEKIATLAVVGLVLGIVGYFASSDVLGRILTFSYLFLIGTFLAGVLNRPHRQITLNSTVTILVVILIVLNAPAGFPPSHIDENIDITNDGYHQVTPIENEGPVAGQWLAQYHDDSQTVAVGTYYSPIVFYYGETSRIRFPHITNPYSGTVLIDPKRGLTVRFESVRYYDNGRVTFQEGRNMMIVQDNLTIN